MDGADHRFLDQIRDSKRRVICVGATGPCYAGRAAPPAREPRHNPLGGYSKGVDRVLEDRGQACRQTGCAETAGRLLPDPDDQLLPGLLHPIPDDGVSEHPDPGSCHGGGVRYEAARETVTQVRRGLFAKPGRQRDRLGQARWAAEEDRDAVAQPVACPVLQQPAHHLPGVRQHPSGARAGRAGGARGRVEQVTGPGRQPVQHRSSGTSR